MFSSMTIKHKIFGFGLLSLAFAAAIAGAGYWGQQRMNHAMSDVMASSTAQKNLLQADMMHDALRADVLTAMLAGQKPEKQRAEEGKQIVESLREHAGVFRESIDENKSLPLDAGIKERIAESESVLNAYIGAAESAVALALRDQAAARAQYPEFIKAFKAAELKIGDLSELIEGAAKQAHSGSSEAADAALLAIVVGLLVCTLVLLAIAVAFIRSITSSWPVQEMVRFLFRKVFRETHGSSEMPCSPTAAHRASLEPIQAPCSWECPF